MSLLDDAGLDRHLADEVESRLDGSAQAAACSSFSDSTASSAAAQRSSATPPPSTMPSSIGC